MAEETDGDSERLDEVINGVPMFELRVFLINMTILTTSICGKEEPDLANVFKSHKLLESKEHDFYFWMTRVLGDPGKIFASDLVRDTHELFMLATRASAAAEQVQKARIEKACLKVVEHSGTLHNLIRMHFILNDREPPPLPESRKYRIALSFAGENRDIVSQVADMLAFKFSEKEILYDNYHTHIWAQPDLDIVLPPLYRTESDLIVVFISAFYAEKEWCGLEMRHIRALIKEKQGHRIMLLRFDNADVDGLVSTDGYIDIKCMPPLQIARKINARYEHLTLKVN